MERPMDEWVHQRRMDGWMDRVVDGWSEGWMDGRTDGQTNDIKRKRIEIHVTLLLR